MSPSNRSDRAVVTQELTFHRLLLPVMRRKANKPCVTSAATGATTTFGEHLDRIGRLSAGLASIGVDRGDRYAVMALNSPEYLELYHAAFFGAGVINPLNLRFAPKELAYVLADSGTKVCFVDSFFAPLIDSVKADAGLEHVVLIGDGDVPHTLRYDELLAHDPALPEEGNESDPVLLMYTGGTTGLPKGVLMDQRSEVLNVHHFLMNLSFPSDAISLIQTPMFHAASMQGIAGLPTLGVHSIILPMFEPGALMAAWRAYQPNVTVMVPTMIAMTFAHPDFTPDVFESLRFLGYGASPMPEALLEQLLALYPNADIGQGYGMTEAAALLTMLLPDEHRQGGKYLRSAGLPIPGTELSIRDDAGHPVPTGTAGEVWARGGNFMIEYWNKPEATAEVFADGWYHTGDAGYLDEDGYLYLVDRVKDMIVTGGENVYSSEVENAVASHPAVLQVAVIGIPSDKWGEAVHAIVVLRPDATATAEEIIAFCRDEIAGYKIPKSVEFRTDPLPLSGAMKVLKRELRAPYWEGRERLVN